MINNMVMFKANVYEVKARLSEFLDRAAGGERILICRHNKPVAELRAIDEGRSEPRPIGPLPGRPAFDVPQSFFEPLPDAELGLWEGVAPGDRLSRAGRKPAQSRAPHAAEARGRFNDAPKRLRRKRS